MSNIAHANINAILSDATYALGKEEQGDLSGATGIRLAGFLADRMTPTLANYIGDNFVVVTHIESGDVLGSGFDATVWKENATGKVFISMQGTTGLQDFLTDVNLALTGNARAQVTSMINWWLAISTPSNQMAPQIQDVGANYFARAPVSGLGLLSSADFAAGVEVNGHSLGGYLATAFTRLFGVQANVHHTSTFNSAGFGAGSEAVFVQLLSLINPNFGLGRFPNQLEQSNYFAVNGLNVTTNSLWFSQVGQRVELFNERNLTQFGNHYIYKLTDTLALGASLAQLDPDLDTVRLNAILSAGSSQMAASIEGVLDGLQRLLLGPGLGPVGIGDAGDSAATRTSYHATLKALADTNTFKSLIGKLTLGPIYLATDLTEGAKTDFTKFIALQQLIPFSVQDASGTGTLINVLQRTYADFDALWQSDRMLTQAQRDAGLGHFTDAYLTDRALLLKTIVASNTADNGSIGNTLALATDRSYEFRYADVYSGAQIILLGGNTARQGGVLTPVPSQLIHFGSAGHDTLDGSQNKLGDHLYGGAGNDSASGLSGDDYLEGNAGTDVLLGGSGADTMLGGADADTLDGGAQADTLLGGLGDDRYTLRAADGVATDTLLDADGLGSIAIVDADGNSTVLGSSAFVRVADATRLWRSEDGRFTLGTLDESDGSVTLTVSGAGVSARVLRWEAGALGLNLPGGVLPAEPPATLGISVSGDLAPMDANPQIEGVQLQYDLLGNVIVGTQAAPDRSDTLYDSPLSDHLSSYGGNDLIYASRGGDDWVQAGSGIDHAELGAGDDWAEMGSGRDNALGGGGDDEMHGDGVRSLQAVLDELTPGVDAQADLLAGNEGADTLVGGASADALWGGDGEDWLIGGAGDDNLFGDFDVTASSNLWSVSRQSPETDVNGASTFTFSINGIGWGSGSAPLGDLLIGGAGDDALLAGAGNDNLDGGADQDSMFGGSGHDAIVAGTGHDVVRGDGYASTGSLAYAAASEHGNDLIEGGAGDDWLYGDGGDDQVHGDAGNDLIEGDAMDVAHAYHGSDTLDGGTGRDTLYGGARADQMSGGDDDDFLFGDLAGSGTPDGSLHGDDFAEGGAGADQLVGDGGADTLLGGSGLDFLYGDNPYLDPSHHGADLLDGGDDTDQLVGGGGGDTLLGGAGDDFLFGDDDGATGATEGNDWLDGGVGNDQLVGYGGGDWLVGSDGDDSLFGQAGADLLFGGAGSDQLSGGEGDDTYLFQRGDSPVGFEEFVNDTEGTNHLVLEGMDVASMNLVPTTDADVHLLQAGSDSIFIRGLRSGRIGTVNLSETSHSANAFYGMTFAYSVVQNATDSSAVLQGGKLADQLSSAGGDATLAGGAGTDSLSASGGNNVFLFHIGDGVDTVTDSSPLLDTSGQPQSSTIHFGEGIASAQLELGTQGGQLRISLGPDSSDVLLVAGFDRNNALAPHAIDNFEFADGTMLTRAQLLARGFDMRGTAGAEWLLGTSLEDRFESGAGNDSMTGGAGADTYHFGLDDGVDLIGDADPSIGTADTLQLGEDFQLAWLEASRIGDDLVLGVGTDRVTLRNHFIGGADAIEHILLADGSELTVADIAAKLDLGSSASDTVTGDATANGLFGQAGNDRLLGLDGADTLHGGTGHDTLEGGLGDDFYRIDLGDGHDTVIDAGGADLLVFGPGIGPVDMRVAQTGNALVLSHASGSQSVTLQDYFLAGSAAGAVEVIEFADGTRWGMAEVVATGLAATEGDDTIIGFSLDDAVNGLAGNDSIHGGAGADTLAGGLGNDTMQGGAGADTYVFARGDGSELIVNAAGDDAQSVDRLAFGGGITANEVSLSRGGEDLVLTLAAGNDGVRIQNYFLGGAHVVEQIDFADGTSWDEQDILTFLPPPPRVLTGTAGNDAISGDSRDELLQGLAGNDTLLASDGNDTLAGGTGGDRLYGGFGDDTYLMELGDGGSSDERIIDFGGFDVLLAGPSITPDAWPVVSDGYLAGVRYLQVVSLGVFVMDYWGSGTVEEFRFSDGTVWTDQDIARRLPPISGTSGNDSLTGTNLADVMNGSDGNDTLRGAGGRDTVSGSLGNDLLFGDAGDDELNGQEDADDLRGGDGTDLLLGGAGNDILNGDAGADYVHGEDGVDTVYGNAGDDFVTGGAGADALYGGDGSDQLQGGVDPARKIAYRDTLNGEAGNDWLEAQTAPADMYGGSGNDLYFGGAGAELIVEDASDNSHNLIHGAGGADALRMHGGGAGLVIGGLGADSIQGGLAAGGVRSKLVIAFNKSDGIDSVSLLAPGSTISIGGGALYSSLSFEVVGQNLRLKTGSSHYIELVDWYGTGAGQGPNVSTLQIVTEGTRDYLPTSTDPLKNRKIQTFDFLALVAAYEASGRSRGFSIASRLAAAHLGGSDTAAIGGAIAYQYARSGNLAALTYAEMQSVVDDAAFGDVAQPLNPVGLLTMAAPMAADLAETSTMGQLATAPGSATQPTRGPRSMLTGNTRSGASAHSGANADLDAPPPEPTSSATPAWATDHLPALQSAGADAATDHASGESLDALIDRWFRTSSSGDPLSQFDEILKGDTVGLAPMEPRRHEIPVAWQRSHAWLARRLSGADDWDTDAGGGGLAPGVDLGIGLDRMAVPSPVVGLRSVAGHELRSFRGLQEGLPSLGSM